MWRTGILPGAQFWGLVVLTAAGVAPRLAAVGRIHRIRGSRMRHMSGVGKLAALVAGALCAGLAVAADPPDFTGVWTNAGRPSIGGGRAPGPPPAPPPLKPEAKARIDAYNALVAKSGASPGGYCLGTGMPGSMLGSGGYPMEIIQRPDQITVIYEAHTKCAVSTSALAMPRQEDRVPGRNGYSFGPLGRRHAGGRDGQPRRPGGPAHYDRIPTRRPSSSGIGSMARMSRDAASSSPR